MLPSIFYTWETEQLTVVVPTVLLFDQVSIFRSNILHWTLLPIGFG